MRDGGRLPSPASIPSFASYNITCRFLSLSQGQQKQREKKRRNIRKLVQKHTIVAVLETHCTGLKAVHCFFSEIEGIKVFYQEGKEAIVFLVDEKWSKENSPELISIIPGVMATLHWKAEGRDSWLTSFRLDAKDEKERIRQLAIGTLWAQGHIGPKDITIFGGDRNFVRKTSEKQSRRNTWRPSTKMNEAWTKFLKGHGNAQETEQPEYTWGRVVKHENSDENDIDRSAPGSSAIQEGDTASWTYEVLDVVGTNVDSYDQIAHQAMAKRCDDVPHPAASDHWPVSLEWRSLERRQHQRKRARTANVLVKRPIPVWLLDDEAFLEQVDDWVE